MTPLQNDRFPQKDEPPRSAACQPINLIGLACFLATAAYARATPDLSPLAAAFLVVLAFAIPVAALEAVFLKTWAKPTTGLDWAAPRRANLERVAVKLLGLWTTLAIIGFFYLIFPQYEDPLFTPFWAALNWGLPVFALLSPVYFLLIDARMRAPHDGFWHTGALMLGWREAVDLGRLKQHALGWGVKGFFLPLMFSYFYANLDGLRHADLTGRSIADWFRMGWDLLILVDVGCIVAGYTLTVRAIDAHIRSAEPTWSGWIPAIICYQPFWGLMGSAYFAYNSDFGWVEVLEGYPVLQALWSGCILFFMGVYTWASLSFGLRFSNLTHRGIITDGPYRYTKHPAYVCKNLSWWMEALPFMLPVMMGLRHGAWNGLWGLAARRCLRLLGVNLIYYIRAKTEERHLSQDPDYVAYALWIERNGLLRFLPRVIRWIRYTPPQIPAEPSRHSPGEAPEK